VNAAFKIIGGAYVERAIGTLEDIGIEHVGIVAKTKEY
jgi:hypothetical protein